MLQALVTVVAAAFIALSLPEQSGIVKSDRSETDVPYIQSASVPIYLVWRRPGVLSKLKQTSQDSPEEERSCN